MYIERRVYKVENTDKYYYDNMNSISNLVSSDKLLGKLYDEKFDKGNDWYSEPSNLISDRLYLRKMYNAEKKRNRLLNKDNSDYKERKNSRLSW